MEKKQIGGTFGGTLGGTCTMKIITHSNPHKCKKIAVKYINLMFRPPIRTLHILI